MKNWKRILAAAGTAALLVSNLGAVSQVTFAAEESSITEDIPAETETQPEENEPEVEPQVEETQEQEVTETPAPEQGEKQPDETTETPAVVTPSNNGETTGGEQPTEPKVENPVQPTEPANEGSTKEEETKEPEVVVEPAKEGTVVEQPEVVVQPTEGTTEEPEVEEPEEETKADENLLEYLPEKPINGMTVKAYAAPDVIPEGSKLITTLIQSQKDLDKVADELDKSEAVEEYDGFVALDVHFVDPNGGKIQPEDGKVQVTFEFEEDGLIPAEADTDTLAVQHFDESGSEMKVVSVADTTEDESTGSVDVEKATEEDVAPAITAEFEVESFSTFAITWSDYFKITVHYYDSTNAADIDASQGNITISDGKTITFADYINKVDTSEYSFTEARYGNVNGSVVTSVLATDYKKYGHRSITFKNENTTVATLDRYWLSDQESADVYLIYSKIDTPAPVEPEKSLSKSKTVTDNEDGTYNLALSVSGAVGKSTKKTKLDILLIVDKSGSMAWKIDKDREEASRGNSRIDKIATAVTSMASAISDKSDAIDARYSLVEFSSAGYNGYGDDGAKVTVDWTDDSNAIVDQIKENVAGGTNYQAGIEKGIKQLKNRVRDGAETVVIFLTDGEPTFRFEQGFGGRYEDGTGNSDKQGKNIAAAVEAIGNMSCNYFYAIGVGPSFGNSTVQTPSGTAQENLYKLQNAVKATNHAWYSASDDTKLKSIFTDIAGKITEYLTDHVSLSDSLSKETEIVPKVEIVKDTDLNIKVTKKVDNQEITVKEGQGSITLDKTDRNDQTTITASYDDSTRTIKLNFPEKYVLEPDYTYTVSTTIRPTEAAYEMYRKNGGYNGGDKGASDSGTWAGQTGIYTNGDATITYQYNGETKTESFDKPVMQLKVGTLTITKSFEGLSVTQIESLRSQLQFEVGLTWNVKGNTANNDNDQYLPKTITLDEFTYDASSKTYTYSYVGLSPETSYQITESGVDVTDYDCTTTVDGTAVTDGKTSGKVAKGATVATAYKNSYERSVGNLKITKTLDGDKEYVDASKTYEITVTVADASGEYSAVKTDSAGKTSDTKIIFTSNSTTVTLGSGESIEIKGLSNGKAYSVVEAENSSKGFTVSYENQSGSIVKGATTEVKVTNKMTVVKTGVNLGSDAILGAVLAIDAAVAMFLLYGYVRRRVNY